jgi:hypothetical protein
LPAPFGKVVGDRPEPEAKFISWSLGGERMKVRALLVCALVCLASRSAIPQTTESLSFIRKILNASPAEVEKVLGKPDELDSAASDCAELPAGCTRAFYKNRKFEVLYYKNRLKWMQVNGRFDKGALQQIGFSPVPPTWEHNKFGSVAWLSAADRGTATGPPITIPGMMGVQAFRHPTVEDRNYMLIRIRADYDKRY